MVFSFFEGHTTDFPEGFDRLFWEKTLQTIWRERYSFGLEDNTRFEFKRDCKQVLLNFTEKGIKGGDFVGSVSKNGHRINIFPKIFWSSTNDDYSQTDEFAKYVFSHLFWWMGYTRDNLRLVKIETDSGDTNGDLLEILIYFFAFYTERLLEEFSFNDYELIQNEGPVVRGRILMFDWIKNISKQNWQEIPCEYSEFQHDNHLNRIIKYVAGILLSITNNKKSKLLLNDILYHLEGVSDIEISVNDCDKVKLNPLFEEYRIVLDSCRMFLDCLIVDPNDTSRSSFSFLVKMDWLYQQFLFGFINKNKDCFNLKKVRVSKDYIGRVKGTNRNYFNIDLDYMFFFNDGSRLIGDAKYKRLYNLSESEEGLSKYKIDSADLYQMIAYSYRKGIKDIILLYPKYDDPKHFRTIIEKFEILNSRGEPDIELTVCNLAISQGKDFNFNSYSQNSFSLLENALIEELKKSLCA
jgi:5-methylcytosine-specific restriction enzyme subunit McrC